MNRDDALRLAAEKPEECRTQLDRLPTKNPRNPGGWLRRAIEGEYGPSAEDLKRQKREATAEGEARKKRAEKAREAHEERFFPQYEAYLREAEKSLAEGHTEAHNAFLEAERKTREPFLHLKVGKLLREFDAERAHLRRLQEHFAHYAPHPVLSFWEWDARHNPEALREPAMRAA